MSGDPKMKVTICARPAYLFKLPPEIVVLIKRMSDAHYDFVCKQASQPGGFIFGWMNVMRYTELELTATSHELDTLFKICENSSFLTNEERSSVFQVVLALHKARRKFGEVSGKWTEEVGG